MKRISKVFKRLSTFLLAVFTLVTMFPDMYKASKVKAASSIYDASYNISYNTHQKNEIGKEVNLGNVVLPLEDGKYPVLFLVHGSGGVGDWDRTAARYMDYWVRCGYVDPMVIIVPRIDNYLETQWGATDFKYYISKGYCETLVNALKSGSASKISSTLNISGADAERIVSKVDVNAPMSFTGFSMGGACALYAGCKMPGVFANIGGCSPASTFYNYNSPNGGGDPKWFFVLDKSELKFSSSEDAHLLMEYGVSEQSGEFKNNVTSFKSIIDSTGLNKNSFAVKSFSSAYGGHAHKLFKREIFTFLYYVKNGELPADEIIEVACRNETDPKDAVSGVGVNGIKGIVKVSGTLQSGQTLTAKVTDSNVTKFSYQWRRGNANISGATSATYKLTSSDIGKKISCKVTDASGSYKGFISGNATGTIKEGSTSLTGTVTLSETKNVRYPNGISVKVTGSNSKNLKYQWMRGTTAISGATSTYYTIQKEDIGKKLSCKVTDGSGKYTGSISSAQVTVKKACGPAAPKNLTATACTNGQSNGKISNVTTKMEYAFGSQDATYTSCTGTEITGLAPGFYFVRVKETKTTEAGAITMVEVKNDQVLTGTVKITGGEIRYLYAVEAKVTGSNSKKLKYQWMRGNTAISGATSKYYTIQKADIGKKLSCVVTDGSGKYTGSISSSKTTVKKAYGPAAPKNLKAVACTNGKKNGKILNVTSKMEYAYGSQNAEYKDCPDSEMTGLASGDYYIRMKETATTLPGAITIVTVKSGKTTK